MNNPVTLPREVVEQALEAMSLALSDVDWRKDSPTQPVIHKAYNATSAALEQPQIQSGGIPPNWKLVPVEPTIRMRLSARAWTDAPTSVYHAMLAAAPQSPALERPNVDHCKDGSCDCCWTDKPQPQVEQPVAWAVMQAGRVCWEADYPFSNEPGWCDSDQESVSLYTRPQQPLSEDAILEIWKDKYRSWIGSEQFLHIFQHVEAIHHIEEKQ